MQKETITFRNAFFLIIMMQISSKVLLGFHGHMKQDTWITLLMATVPTTLLMLLYARMMKLMPGLDIYEMAEATLGKAGAKIVAFLMGYYCLNLATLVLGNYAEFVHITSLFQTPFIIVSMLISMACLYLSKSAMETVGKWCAVMVAVSAVTAVVLVFFSWPTMDFTNLQPVMEHGVGELTVASLKLVPLPMGEAVVGLALLGGVETGKGKSPYKLWVGAGMISILFLLEIFVRTCTILGSEMMETVYFPTYKAASLIRIGTFLERIEALLAFVYILAGISKVAACQIAASRGVAKLFSMPSYKPILLPVAFLSMAFSSILFHSIVEMFDFIDNYIIYAQLFQIIIPVVIWIVAEVKSRRNTLPAPPLNIPDQHPEPAAG